MIVRADSTIVQGRRLTRPPPVHRPGADVKGGVHDVETAMEMRHLIHDQLVLGPELERGPDVSLEDRRGWMGRMLARRAQTSQDVLGHRFEEAPHV